MDQNNSKQKDKFEKLSKRLHFSKVDNYIKERENFGWTLLSKDQLRPDQTVMVTLQRNISEIDDIKTIKKLEKQYNSLLRPVPLLSIIFALVGGASLAAYFFLKTIVIFYLAFLYVALTCFFIALFTLIIFLLLLIKRKELTAYIIKEASMRSGLSQEFPSKHNIKKETESSWALTHTFKK